MIILFNHLPVDNDNDDQLSLNQSLSLINFKNYPVQKQPKKYESKFKVFWGPQDKYNKKI